jgi:hypothetical protein
VMNGQVVNIPPGGQTISQVLRLRINSLTNGGQ